MWTRLQRSRDTSYDKRVTMWLCSYQPKRELLRISTGFSELQCDSSLNVYFTGYFIGKDTKVFFCCQVFFYNFTLFLSRNFAEPVLAPKERMAHRSDEARRATSAVSNKKYCIWRPESHWATPWQCFDSSYRTGLAQHDCQGGVEVSI